MIPYRRAALSSLAFMHIRWSYGCFHIRIGFSVHCTVRQFVFPEEVTVIESIASGWSGHVLCMDHCPMALGLLKECSSVLRREEDMEWMDDALLICTINRAFLLEKGWEWSIGEHA
jgi:hypothetical protein